MSLGVDGYACPGRGHSTRGDPKGLRLNGHNQTTSGSGHRPPFHDLR